jgi:LacI family transcriptional regulator
VSGTRGQALRPPGRYGNCDPSETERGATLKTIATLAGLGVSTVSRALKDAPEIAGRTKARVHEVAAAVDYRPDRAGVRLRSGRTQVMSLILHPHDEVVGYGTSPILGMSEVLRETGRILAKFLLVRIAREPIESLQRLGEPEPRLRTESQPAGA